MIGDRRVAVESLVGLLFHGGREGFFMSPHLLPAPALSQASPGPIWRKVLHPGRRLVPHDDRS